MTRIHLDRVGPSNFSEPRRMYLWGWKPLLLIWAHADLLLSDPRDSAAVVRGAEAMAARTYRQARRLFNDPDWFAGRYRRAVCTFPPPSPLVNATSRRMPPWLIAREGERMRLIVAFSVLLNPRTVWGRERGLQYLRALACLGPGPRLARAAALIGARPDHELVAVSWSGAALERSTDGSTIKTRFNLEDTTCS